VWLWKLPVLVVRLWRVALEKIKIYLRAVWNLGVWGGPAT